MAKTDQLIEILLAEAPPPARRERLREVAPIARDIGRLINRARDHRSQDPIVAERIARGALMIARVIGDPERRFEARRALAQTNIVLGRPLRALRLLSCRVPDLDRATDAAVALEMSQTLSLLGRREEALQVIAAARRRMPAEGAERQLGLLAAGEAHVYGVANKFQESLACLEEAAGHLRETGSDVLVLSLESNRALALSELGRSAEASALYRDIIPRMQALGLRELLSRAMRSAASLDLAQGRFLDAMRVLQDLVDEAERRGNEVSAALCNLRLAEVNLALHLPTQALDHALRARATLEGLGNLDDVAEADFFAGVAARALGRTVESQQRIEEAYRRFSRSGGVPGKAAICLVRLAESDHARGDLVQAASRTARAVSQLRALGWHERASRAEAFLARLEREGGGPHEAERRLYALLEGPHAPRTPWVRCDVHHQLARVAEHLGKLRPSLRNILTATRILERYRVGIPPDEYMAAFLTSRAELFEDAVRIVLATGCRRAPQRAFELSEQARARALLDLMRMGRSEDSAGEADELLREVGDLEREIDGRVASISTPGPSAASKDAATRVAVLSDRESRLRACLDRLADLSPEGTRQRRGAPLRHSELAQALPQDEVLVEYYLAGDEIHTFVSKDGELRHERRFVGRTALRTRLSRMSFQLERPYVEGSYHVDASPKLIESANAILTELDELLLGPVRDLDGVRRFVIVPHGELHAVPFAALLRDGEPLIQQAEVVVAPSAAVYLHCLRTETATGPALFLGFGDEHAPEIAEEIEALSARVGEHTACVGNAATIQVLERLGPMARSIHLAAHTEYRHDDSMESRLQLADGWLSVPQIYRMRIAPELLVLSGCATGRVSVTRGGDLFGLVRGFLHAGASSILSSLWEVSDGRTREYMDCFYRAYAAGETAASAMRRATLELRDAHAHPYHWAPFVLTGRGG